MDKTAQQTASLVETENAIDSFFFYGIHGIFMVPYVQLVYFVLHSHSVKENCDHSNSKIEVPINVCAN